MTVWVETNLRLTLRPSRNA